MADINLTDTTPVDTAGLTEGGTYGILARTTGENNQTRVSVIGADGEFEQVAQGVFLDLVILVLPGDTIRVQMENPGTADIRLTAKA